MRRISVCLIFCFFFLCFLSEASAQSYWAFNSKRKTRTIIPFRLVNNLIIIKLQINNSSPLNFIVDTGLKATLLTELSYGDSLTLNAADEIQLKGLGGDKTITALSARDNTISIGSLTGYKQDVVILMDNIFHLSEKLGMKIHGIIGYDLFKDHVVEINYSTKRLKIYRPDTYKYKKSEKYKNFPLIWHRFKPYVNLNVMMCDTGEILPMHMLIDTGSSDAIWIFKESMGNTQVPEPNIRTYLGHGLSGEVYGYKARISSIVLGDFKLKEPIASFPDSSDLSIALSYKLRNGSIGGEVLRRFKVIFNYPKSQITLRSSYRMKRPFKFNVSGIELTTPYPGTPVYVIADVRQGSPASEVGLKPGDEILYINSKWAFEYKLQEIQSLLSEESNRYVNISVNREGKTHSFRFKLKKVL